MLTLMMDRSTAVLFTLLVLSGAVFVRMGISLYPYSGAGKPPMYGDYEAQRHWMEITVNLPLNEWYTNTTTNDLNYWGLDYPPLTAYHSWLTGMVSVYYNSNWTSLTKSRGYESYDHKLFMRHSVLVSEVLIFFPAVAAFVCYSTGYSNEDVPSRITFMLVLLLQPSLILIDHGHFQYNSVSLGFVLWAVLCVVQDWNVVGALAFCLALNYKQMELYHALPFFCFLLGKSLRSSKIFISVLKLAVIVVLAFSVCWIPFYIFGGSHGIFQVLLRIFPFKRGLFEDKVASFWCAISVVVKMKQIFSVPVLIRICLVTTLVMVLPTLWKLLWNPTPNRFLLCLVTTSLSFFLFSFQVHEKSILLVTLPVSLLVARHPYFTIWFNAVSAFSMYPLLVRDGLGFPTWSVTAIFLSVSLLGVHVCTSQRLCWTQILLTVSTFSMLVVICGLSHVLLPPPALPDIFPVIISCYSCIMFLATFMYFSYLQLCLPDCIEYQKIYLHAQVEKKHED